MIKPSTQELIDTLYPTKAIEERMREVVNQRGHMLPLSKESKDEFAVEVLYIFKSFFQRNQGLLIEKHFNEEEIISLTNFFKTDAYKKYSSRNEFHVDSAELYEKWYQIIDNKLDECMARDFNLDD